MLVFDQRWILYSILKGSSLCPDAFEGFFPPNESFRGLKGVGDQKTVPVNYGGAHPKSFITKGPLKWPVLRVMVSMLPEHHWLKIYIFNFCTCLFMFMDLHFEFSPEIVNNLGTLGYYSFQQFRSHFHLMYQISNTSKHGIEKWDRQSINKTYCKKSEFWDQF